MSPFLALIRKDFARRWRSPLATIVLLALFGVGVAQVRFTKKLKAKNHGILWQLKQR